MNQGFTLLELLVVLTIVSILTAFSIPQYNTYKQKAFDTRALNDLHNAAIAEEAYYIDKEEYLTCQNDSCTQLPGFAAISAGVELNITVDETGFIATASHPKGSGKTFTWDSHLGGLLKEES